MLLETFLCFNKINHISTDRENLGHGSTNYCHENQKKSKINIREYIVENVGDEEGCAAIDGLCAG